MKNKRLLIIVFSALILLLIPLIAMQFTNEVNWAAIDFVVAGILLVGTGLLTELVLRKIKSMKYRIAIVAILLLALILIWVQLAVGIF